MQRLAKLIADLDAENFDVRESASQELTKLGPDAEPALRAARRDHPSAEMKHRIDELLAKLKTAAWPPERLRARRAISALERAGSVEARQALRELAQKTGDAAEFAAAALRRRAAGGNE